MTLESTPPPIAQPAIALPPYSFEAAFSHGWRAFTSNWLALMLASLVYLLMSIISFIPCLGFFLSFGLGPVLFSLLYMGTRGVRGEKVQFDWLFTQLGRYWSLLLAYLIMMLPMLPMLAISFGMQVFMAMSQQQGQPPKGLPGIACIALPLMLVFLIAAIYFMVRWYMAPFILFDDSDRRIGVIDAFKQSWRMTAPCSLSLFLLMVVMGLILIVGFIALVLGAVLFSFPLYAAVLGGAYALLAGKNPPASPAVAPTNDPMAYP